jgi:hypothetical protein
MRYQMLWGALLTVRRMMIFGHGTASGAVAGSRRSLATGLDLKMFGSLELKRFP